MNQEPKFNGPEEFDVAELDSLIAKSIFPTTPAYFDRFIERARQEEKSELVQQIYYLLSKVCFLLYNLENSKGGFIKPTEGVLLSDISKITPSNLNVLADLLPQITDPELKAAIADVLRYKRFNKEVSHYTLIAAENYLASAQRLFKLRIDHEALPRIARAMQISTLDNTNPDLTSKITAYVESIIEWELRGIILSKGYYNIFNLQQVLINYQSEDFTDPMKPDYASKYLEVLQDMIAGLLINKEASLMEPVEPWFKIMMQIEELKAQWFILKSKRLTNGNESELAKAAMDEARNSFLRVIDIQTKATDIQFDTGRVTALQAKMLIWEVINLLKYQANRPRLLRTNDIGSFKKEIDILVARYTFYEQQESMSPVKQELNPQDNESLFMINRIFKGEADAFFEQPTKYEANLEVEKSKQLVAGLTLKEGLSTLFTRDLIVPASKNLELQAPGVLDLFPLINKDYKGRQEGYIPAASFNLSKGYNPKEHSQILRDRVMFKLAMHHRQKGQLIVDTSLRQLNLEHRFQDSEVPAEVFDFLSNSDFIPPQRIEIFSRGMNLALQGDIATSLHLLIPQIENSLRHLLAVKGFAPEPINELELEELSLTELVYKNKDALIQLLGEELLLNLESLLLAQGLGSNLRNLVMHGLAERGAVPYAEQITSHEGLYLWWMIGHLAIMFNNPDGINLIDKNKKLSLFDVSNLNSPIFIEAGGLVENLAKENILRELISLADSQPNRADRLQALLGGFSKLNEKWDRQDLIEVLKPLLNNNQLVSPDRKAIWSMALVAAIKGDGLESTHLLIPQIEESLRMLLQEKGNLPPFSRDPSMAVSYYTLGKLLNGHNQQLSQILGDDLVADLEYCLNNSHGFNIRNRMAHGYMEVEEFYRPEITYTIYLALKLLAFI